MLRVLALVPLLALSACGGDGAAPAEPVEPQTASDLVDRMLARYEASLGDADAFVAMGAGARARYARLPDSAGAVRFGPPQIGAAGGAPVAPEAALLGYGLVNVPRLADGLRDATFEGPITRDGRRVYVLTAADPSSLLGPPVAADSVTGQALRLYVSAADADVVEIYQSAQIAGQERPVESRILYSDFRETDGLRLPRSVRQIQTGLDQTVTQEERMILGGQLGIARRSAAAMPAGPERDDRLAQIDAQLRALTEGIAEQTLTVDSVGVER